MAADTNQITVLTQGSESVLMLKETPQLDAIHALHEAALVLSREATNVVIDCSTVEHLAGWAVQILVGLQRALAAKEGTLRIRGATEPILKYLSVAGARELAGESHSGGDTCPKPC